MNSATELGKTDWHVPWSVDTNVSHFTASIALGVCDNTVGYYLGNSY